MIQGWYDRPINGRSNSGLGSTPVPKVNKTMKVYYLIEIKARNILNDIEIEN
jgi:hypothetical protein